MKKVLYIIAIFSLILCLCSCSKEVEEQLLNVTSAITETTITSTTAPITEKITEATTEAEVTTTKPNTTTISTSVQKTSKSNITTTKKVTTTQKQTTTKHTTTKKEITTNGCANGNHSMSVGDIGKWFSSRSEVQAYVQTVGNNWLNKYDKGEITRDEYIKNCPQGYKAWSCSSCGKWTGNFTC